MGYSNRIASPSNDGETFNYAKTVTVCDYTEYKATKTNNSPYSGGGNQLGWLWDGLVRSELQSTG